MQQYLDLGRTIYILEMSQVSLKKRFCSIQRKPVMQLHQETWTSETLPYVFPQREDLPHTQDWTDFSIT